MLTITTQIGGIVFLFSVWGSNKMTFKSRVKPLIVFFGLYAIATFLLVPFIAPIFGREKIAISSNLKPANYATIFLNRNYVTKDLNEVLKDISTEIPLRFLDANFPFINEFPLLPHLSHNDGNKIDLSFIYETQDGTPTNKVKSISGYGVFEAPNKGEMDQSKYCKDQGFFQYDYSKYLTFGTRNSELKFSKKENRKLIETIVKNNQIEKVFIEPHLVTRMSLKNRKIRFHGCQAVRHDDHVHIQIKKKKLPQQGL